MGMSFVAVVSAMHMGGLTLLWFAIFVAERYVDQPNSLWASAITPVLVAMCLSGSLLMYVVSLAIVVEGRAVSDLAKRWSSRRLFLVSNMLGVCLIGIGYSWTYIDSSTGWQSFVQFLGVGFCWTIGPTTYITSLTLLPLLPPFSDRATQTAVLVGLLIWVCLGTPIPQLGNAEGTDNCVLKNDAELSRQEFHSQLLKCGLSKKQIAAVSSPSFCAYCLRSKGYCVCELRRAEAALTSQMNSLLYPSLEDMFDPEWKSPLVIGSQSSLFRHNQDGKVDIEPWRSENN